MNNRANYTLIGFLVLSGFFLMLAFGYWLLKPSNEQEVTKYIIYFNESVSGLNIDAPVKYKGVSVGKVLKLSINQADKTQVEVLVEILKTTPIATSTVAILTSQGITGLSYINLTHDNTGSFEVLKKLPNDEYAVIKSAPSLLAKAENVLENMFLNINTTLQGLNSFLDDTNRANISKILKNSADVTQKLNASLDENTTKSLKQSVQNIEDLTKKFDEMMPKIEKLMSNSIEWQDKISTSFSSIATSYIGIQSAMAEFKSAIADGQIDIKSITSDTIPALNATLEDMQTLMQKTNELLHRYEQSPADMIFSSQEFKKAPGE